MKKSKVFLGFCMMLVVGMIMAVSFPNSNLSSNFNTNNNTQAVNYSYLNELPY